MKKRRLLCLMLASLMFFLSGCISSLPKEKEATDQRLPEIRSGPEAPLSDSQTSWTTSAVLYVPDAEATRLNTVVQTVVVESGQTKQQAFVEALLRVINASEFQTGTQELRLSTISNAVETSGELVTVNLHTSMRALSAQKQFALRMAIINTLTELPETRYVNILVNGMDIGLDVGETIPTGVMSRYTSSDIATYWNQLQTERMSITGDLQKAVALYFVSNDGKHLLAEVRGKTFTQRDPAGYAKALLEELARGAMSMDGTRTLVPEQDYFERDPVLVNLEGDSYIELYFRSEIRSDLALKNSTDAMMLSSICMTLTGFIPKLDGIIAYIDGDPVTQLRLMDGESWVMANGQITREGVLSLAADTCLVYYPLPNGARLYAEERPIAQRMRTQPRALIRELMKPPASFGLARVMPAEITDADILGLQIQDDTALINVTEAFAEACRGMTAEQERNMVYAIVNTLTELENVTRVRFFVEGTQAPLADHLFMGGEFMRHPGLIYTGELGSL